MERNGQTEKPGIGKKESDDADKCFAVFIIDLGAGWNERREDTRIDDVVEHRQITPIGGEKRLHAQN